MKAYRVELLIIDHDQLGADEIKAVIENVKYPNWCIAPEVKAMTEADIGDWHDDHPLNQHATDEAAYEDYFGGDPT